MSKKNYVRKFSTDEDDNNDPESKNQMVLRPRQRVFYQNCTVRILKSVLNSSVDTPHHSLEASTSGSNSPSCSRNSTYKKMQRKGRENQKVKKVSVGTQTTFESSADEEAVEVKYPTIKEQKNESVIEVSAPKGAELQEMKNPEYIQKIFIPSKNVAIVDKNPKIEEQLKESIINLNHPKKEKKKRMTRKAKRIEKNVNIAKDQHPINEEQKKESIFDGNQAKPEDIQRMTKISKELPKIMPFTSVFVVEDNQRPFIYGHHVKGAERVHINNLKGTQKTFFSIKQIADAADNNPIVKVYPTENAIENTGPKKIDNKRIKKTMPESHATFVPFKNVLVLKDECPTIKDQSTTSNIDGNDSKKTKKKRIKKTMTSLQTALKSSDTGAVSKAKDAIIKEQITVSFSVSKNPKNINVPLKLNQRDIDDNMEDQSHHEAIDVVNANMEDQLKNNIADNTVHHLENKFNKLITFDRVHTKIKKVKKSVSQNNDLKIQYPLKQPIAVGSAHNLRDIFNSVPFSQKKNYTYRKNVSESVASGSGYNIKPTPSIKDDNVEKLIQQLKEFEDFDFLPLTDMPVDFDDYDINDFPSLMKSVNLSCPPKKTSNPKKSSSILTVVDKLLQLKMDKVKGQNLAGNFPKLKEP